ETGNAVVYHATPGSAALGGLSNGTTYYVIRLDDVRIRLADTYAHAISGIALAIDPANLGLGAHSITYGLLTLAITDGIRMVAQAGKDDFIDLKGRLRDPAAQLGDAGSANPNPHTFGIDLIRAGVMGAGTADVILESAVLESATGNAGGVLVRPRPTPADYHVWYNQFRPDDPTNATSGAGVDVGFFGSNPVAIKGTYNFVNSG